MSQRPRDIGMAANFTERFWVKVNRGAATGCWEWTAAKVTNGYGVIWLNGRNAFAHRVAYEMARGLIPDGLQIDHLCRNRACVNPDHLQAVSLAENVLRGIGLTATNRRKTACLRGHPYDSENTYVDRRGWRKCRACARQVAAARRRAG